MNLFDLLEIVNINFLYYGETVEPSFAYVLSTFDTRNKIK